MFRVVLTVVIVSSSFVLRAQVVDSLLRLVPQAKGEKLFDALYGLAYEYSDVQDSLSLVYAEQAVPVAIQLKDTGRILLSLKIKAAQLRRLTRFDESLALEKIVYVGSKKRRDTFLLKNVTNAMGLIYQAKGEFDLSIRMLSESLALREKRGTKSELAMTALNLGSVYFDIGEFDVALKFSIQSLKLKEDAKDNYDKDILLLNIANVYFARNDFQTAKIYLMKSKEACGTNCSVKMIGMIAGSEGRVAIRDHKFDEAVKALAVSQEFCLKAHDINKYIEVELLRSTMYEELSEFKLAEEALDRAERSAIKYGLRRRLYHIYKMKTEIYEKVGKRAEHDESMTKFIKVTDSIYGANVMKGIAETVFESDSEQNPTPIPQGERMEKKIDLRMPILFSLLMLALIITILARKLSAKNNEIFQMKSLVRTIQIEGIANFDKLSFDRGAEYTTLSTLKEFLEKHQPNPQT